MKLVNVQFTNNEQEAKGFAKRVESVKNMLSKKCIGKIIFVIVFAMIGLIIQNLKIIGFLNLKCRERTVRQY